jgi:hypothetical protein
MITIAQAASLAETELSQAQKSACTTATRISTDAGGSAIKEGEQSARARELGLLARGPFLLRPLGNLRLVKDRRDGELQRP